jgi:hypothetical protein
VKAFNKRVRVASVRTVPLYALLAWVAAVFLLILALNSSSVPRYLCIVSACLSSVLGLLIFVRRARLMFFLTYVAHVRESRRANIDLGVRL